MLRLSLAVSSRIWLVTNIFLWCSGFYRKAIMAFFFSMFLHFFKLRHHHWICWYVVVVVVVVRPSYSKTTMTSKPGQMDRQVVASGRKFNLRRDLRSVAKRVCKFYRKYTQVAGRRSGLMVSAFDSGASGPGSSPGRGHCVVFLGKTLHSHSASLHPGV